MHSYIYKIINIINMDRLYTNLCNNIINIVKCKNNTMEFKEVNYEYDSVYFDNVFDENDFKNIKEFNDENWINSMALISLKLFSFFNNRTGNLKYIYNIADNDMKLELLTNYKLFINKLCSNRSIDRLLKASKIKVNKNDNMNIKLTDLINDINDINKIKDPNFIASIIDIIFNDEDARLTFINSINSYIPLFEYTSTDDDFFKSIKDIIIMLMNIHLGTIKSTQHLKDFISGYINELFNKSEFLKRAVLMFESNSYSKFQCNCTIRKYSDIKDCFCSDLKSIRYIETTGYKPLHIKSHIKHIILKCINIMIYMYKDNNINEYKHKVENYIKDPEINVEIKKFLSLLIPNSDNIKVIDILKNIINNRTDICNFYKDNSDNIKKFIKSIIYKLDILEEYKCKIYDYVLKFIDEIDINYISDDLDNNINTALTVIENNYDKIEPYLNHISNRFQLHKYKKYNNYKI
jgi:hypothetical protein